MALPSPVVLEQGRSLWQESPQSAQQRRGRAWLLPLAALARPVPLRVRPLSIEISRSGEEDQMTATMYRSALLAALALALAGCGEGKDTPSVASAAAAPGADSTRVRTEELGPGVTVDTQKIEDSTVAEMYAPEDSAEGN
jgi:hypothetical protein